MSGSFIYIERSDERVSGRVCALWIQLRGRVSDVGEVESERPRGTIEGEEYLLRLVSECVWLIEWGFYALLKYGFQIHFIYVLITSCRGKLMVL